MAHGFDRASPIPVGKNILIAGAGIIGMLVSFITGNGNVVYLLQAAGCSRQCGQITVVKLEIGHRKVK